MESTEQVLLAGLENQPVAEKPQEEPKEEIVDADKIINPDEKPAEPVEEPKSEELKEGEVYKINIDGEEQELTLDQLKNLASKSGGAEERFRELNHYKNELYDYMSNFKENFKKDPAKMLESLDIDPTKVSQDHLYKQLEYDAMTEEQKKNFDLSRENTRLKQEQEEEKKQLEEKEDTVMANELRNQYYGEFAEALEKSNLPKTPTIVSKMASKKIAGMHRGVDLSADQLVKLVEKDLISDFKTIGSDLQADKFKDIFGDGLFKKVREFQASSVKDPKSENKANPDLISKSTRKSKPKSRSMQDFRDEMETLIQAGK